MNHPNSKILLSQYTGPLAYALADIPPAPTPPAAPPEGEPAAVVPPPPPAGGEGDDDPITAPNPFEAGKPEHDAFERQREKFKVRLEKEKTAAAEAATASLSGKMDDLLKKLGDSAPATTTPPAAPDTKQATKATAEEVEIVKDALRQAGIDPDAIVQERRKQEVAVALAQIRKNYPDVQFEDVALVKFANDNGISQMGGTPYDILELSFMRMKRDAIRAGVAPPPPPPPKKEAVPITTTSTKKETSTPEDKPKGLAGWRSRILGKYGA